MFGVWRIAGSDGFASVSRLAEDGTLFARQHLVNAQFGGVHLPVDSRLERSFAIKEGKKLLRLIAVLLHKGGYAVADSTLACTQFFNTLARLEGDVLYFAFLGCREVFDYLAYLRLFMLLAGLLFVLRSKGKREDKHKNYG